MALAGDFIQVLVGGYDLTGDSNRIAIGDRYVSHDVTAFGDQVHNFVLGQRQIAIDHAGYMNSAAGQSHPVLRGAAVQGVMSVFVGSNAAPTVGSPVYSTEVRQSKYATMPEASRFIPFMASFASRGGGNNGWGVALTPPFSFVASGTGTGVDNGGPTTNGGAAYLHVLQAAASDTYVITVEGATNSGFSTGLVTLGTPFVLNASQLGSERIAISGTIPQFTRFKVTRTGSAGNVVRIAVSLMRF